MKDKIKVYHLQGMLNYSNWIPNKVIVNNLEEADLVLAEGGADVSPELYGEQQHPFTITNPKRDAEETQILKKAIELKIPILGICRGSQLTCVMAGGKLVQHQENPKFLHKIKTYDDKEIEVTSTHHQAQYPFNLKNEEYKILGWTTDISRYHEDGNKKELNPKVECEIVYYPKIKGLAIQSHPEMLDLNHPTINYMQDLFNNFINNKL